MAAWQVDFYVIPRRAVDSAPLPNTADALESTNWWAEARLPADYQSRFSAMVPASAAASRDLETWGVADSNWIEVRSEAGRPLSVRVRIDVRRPDSRFAAGLITFVRAASAVLVRADGSVTEPNAGAFGAALRGSAAWRFTQTPDVSR